MTVATKPDTEERRMDHLRGKVALVTGASRGIGRAIAVAFAREGLDVAINYRERAAEAEAVAAEVEARGRRALAFRADVSKAAEVDALVSAVEAKLGPIDVLVNNAGIARYQRVEEATEADWDEIMDVNLKSVFLVTKRVLPGMRERRFGRIINLSSVAAHIGGVVGPHYAASKAGILGFTRWLARHYAKEGITANSIAPALVETEMVTSLPSANPALIPIGRFGHVDEVSSIAVMLAGDGYVNGQTLNADGGLYMT
jgi:3-oxoacyl-[acyl-carrier protein] reductase